MSEEPPPRPVVHLPELPTHDEVLRMQKRARTIATLPEVRCEANDTMECLQRTDVSPSTPPGNDDMGCREAPSASQRGVICVHQPPLSTGLELHERTGSSPAPKHPSGKPSMHTLIRQAAASTAPTVRGDQQNQSTRRQPGLSFLHRITQMRWKHAVDSALDTSPMRSMLSHFSPSRFQREITDDDSCHQMPDLLIPAQSAHLDNVWQAFQQKDVDSNPDISTFASQPCHQISCGCHTWEMPHMGPVLRSSATGDARLVAVLTESRVLLWQTRSSLPPVNLAGLPAPDINSCLLTPSGQMLFLSSKAVIRVLWVKHQRPVPGIAIAAVLTSHGGARWSQPHACGSGSLLIGEGGELVVPDHSTITSMTTDPSELHLLANTSSLSLLVWDLSRAGFSRHVIYQEPPVQVLVGAIPGPGVSERPDTTHALRQSGGGGRNILATAMLSIAHSSRAKADPNSGAPPFADKQSWQGTSFTEFLPPNGELLVHLSSSGLLALVFSGSGEVASRFWPEKHAIYKTHTGVYVGVIGGLIVSCHDSDAVLWELQANEASMHGLLQGHQAEILKIRLLSGGSTQLVALLRPGDRQGATPPAIRHVMGTVYRRGLPQRA